MQVSFRSLERPRFKLLKFGAVLCGVFFAQANVLAVDEAGKCVHVPKEILTLMLCVPTDEDEDDDNIEIDTNEEAPECSVTGGGDELTNLENDLDSMGNLNNGYFVYFA